MAHAVRSARANLSDRAQAEWQRRTRAERFSLLALGLLLVLGLAWRVWLLFAVRPAFLGYFDTGGYISSAQSISSGHWFNLYLQTDGYPAFLALLHAVSPHLRLVVVVQHALGVASGLLLYAAVRRAGGPPWLGLLPAAVVLVGGENVLSEHTILTEPLFIFLVSVGLYAGVRSARSSPFWWPLLAALTLGLATIVRPAGLLLGPVLVLWLAFERTPSWRRALLRAGAAALVLVLLIGGYSYAQRRMNGYFGLSQGGIVNLYGRVAKFADCRKFTPPPGTQQACDPTPPNQRTGWVDQYIFDPSVASALNALGPPGRERDKKVGRFTRAVILHQPLDYAWAILRDTWRYVDPGSQGSGGDPEWEGHWNELTMLPGNPQRTTDFRPYYPQPGLAQNQGALAVMRSFTRLTRPQGLVMLAVILLMLVAPFTVPRSARPAARWVTLIALVLMLSPVAGLAWTARLVIPAIAPMCAAGALGGWGVYRTARQWALRRRSAEAHPAERPRLARLSSSEPTAR